MVQQMEERHSIWIRIFHWTNMVAITVLCLTGFYIHAPETFKIFSSMDTARTIHFGMAYVLCFGVLGRVYYAIVANDAKNIVYAPIKDTKKLP
ncbi:MAG: Ni/Fe-hydrogenase, b-type cytochrome subunit, partial [Syntrophomonadaceae bacterium]|nr:Ni/Fe-hydrogenase, b-type cytochrome subunit [Syntrophomonadaceae bacterium]